MQCEKIKRRALRSDLLCSIDIYRSCVVLLISFNISFRVKTLQEQQSDKHSSIREI